MARRPAPLNVMSYDGWVSIQLCPQLKEYVFMNKATQAPLLQPHLLRQALEALEAECAWGGPTPKTAAAIDALRKNIEAQRRQPIMTTAKTTSERVEKLRQEREALGLRRRELYAHDDDWPKLQELAAKLQRKRERDAKRAKG